MEIEYDSWKDDHAVDISSDHESAAAPSQASNSVAEQHTSLMPACDSTGNAAAVATITFHQTSSSESIKHGPSQDQQADDDRKHGQNRNETVSKKATEVCRNIASVFLFLLVIIVVTLITGSLALVFIPGIIICLVLAFMITGLQQFARCDDYADLDDEYDTDLGTYRYALVVWMFQLTGILVGELLLFLVLFRIGPFALRRLSLLDVHVWKWLLIGTIVLVYFCFWLLTHMVLHEARDKSLIPSVFFRVHMLPILKGLLGVAVCVFYFLVELLILKLALPLGRPKILGLYVHKWTHALVYVFIGLNVSRIISASIVAMLQKKHEQYGKSDYNTNPAARRENKRGSGGVLDFVRGVCSFIMGLLFKRFDPKKCMVYVVIGLRRSINFVLFSIWLLVTWISHFEQQFQRSRYTFWILRVGTATLICLLIFAIIWPVRNSIMLWWQYRSIYSRFYYEVLEEGINLYLLGMICGQHLDVLKVGWNGQENNSEESRKRRINRVVAKARATLVLPKEKKNADRHKRSYQPDIYAIMRMVQYFLRAEDTFKKDINASFEELRKTWRNAHPAYDQDANSTPLTLGLIEAAYGTHLSGDEFKNLLISQIKGDENSEEQVYLQDFERWMETSHKICYNIASTLASAQRLAQYLNRAMIAVIMIVTISIWLILVTKNTKIVGLVGGTLVALSFIFGDTVATVFKGIIFSYVIEPYGIGDICIIKDTWYEVKRIGLWTTTFLKVETNEVVSYPNSALFNDPIINKRNEKDSLRNEKGLMTTF